MRPHAHLVPFALATLALAACQGSPTSDSSGAAGRTPGAAGTGGGLDASAGDANLNDATPPPATCNASPTPLRTSGGTLALPIEPRLGGKPFVFGEPNAGPAGSTILPLNVRFYVSHVALARAAGAPVPVDLVTTAGAPEPYGVHLFNAEDPASQTLRVLAPPGTYTGLTFTLGLDDACNSQTPTGRDEPLTAPLTDASQMVWPHVAGYLFLRYEAQVTPGAGPDAGAAEGLPPAMIHMGGAPGHIFAPRVTASGPLTIGAGQSTTRPLLLDMGAVFTGATSALDPSTPPSPLAIFPGVLPGDRLLQHAPELPIFVLGP